MTKLSAAERKYLAERCHDGIHGRQLLIDAVKQSGYWGPSWNKGDDYAELRTLKNNAEINRHECKIVGLKKVRDDVHNDGPIKRFLRTIEDYGL